MVDSAKNPVISVSTMFSGLSNIFLIHSSVNTKWHVAANRILSQRQPFTCIRGLRSCRREAFAIPKPYIANQARVLRRFPKSMQLPSTVNVGECDHVRYNQNAEIDPCLCQRPTYPKRHCTCGCRTNSPLARLRP